MYEQIFGKASVFLSREFLAKGIFPAAVVLLIGLSISRGWSSAISDVAAVLKTPLAHMSALVEGILTLLLTAAVFEVCALHIFSFFDGSALQTRPREWLRKRSTAQRKLLQDRVEEYEVRATLLNWMRFRNQTGLPFSPPPERLLDRDRASQAIKRASDLLSELDRRNFESEKFQAILDTWQANILAEGLGAMRHERFSAADGQAALKIARAWARRLRRPHNKQLAQTLETALRVEWSRAQTALTRQFPDHTEVQPTRLGNVLAALDHYGEVRYGVPTSVVWSRIWWLLTEGERGSVSASKLSVDVGVNLTAALLVSPFSIVIFWLLARPLSNAGTGHDDPLLHSWTWALIGLATLFVARLCYLMTVSLVATLADKVTALLDLRRLQCLRQMGFDPKSLAAEQGVLKELWLFLVQGSPLCETAATVYAGIGKAESGAAAEGSGESKRKGKQEKEGSQEEAEDDDVDSDEGD